MRLGTAVKRIAVPELLELGFTLVVSDSYGHLFENSTGTRTILFDRNILTPGFLRVCYHYVNSYYGNYSGVQLDNLCPAMRMGFDVFPSSPDQVVETLRILIMITKDKVLPYIDYIADNEVFFTNEMYNKLSENTLEKAVLFAKLNGLDFTTSPQNAQVIESILLDMRGDDRYQRRSRYKIYSDDIIALTAYWGESIRRRDGESNFGTWQWEKEDDYLEVRRLYGMGACDSMPTFDLEAHKPEYIIQFKEYGYNPAITIIGFWNRYPEQYNNACARLTF